MGFRKRLRAKCKNHSTQPIFYHQSLTSFFMAWKKSENPWYLKTPWNLNFCLLNRVFPRHKPINNQKSTYNTNSPHHQHGAILYYGFYLYIAHALCQTVPCQMSSKCEFFLLWSNLEPESLRGTGPSYLQYGYSLEDKCCPGVTTSHNVGTLQIPFLAGSRQHAFSAAAPSPFPLSFSRLLPCRLLESLKVFLISNGQSEDGSHWQLSLQMTSQCQTVYHILIYLN